MPKKVISREDIPVHILAAKRQALAQLLATTEAPSRRAAFAVSTRPSHNVVGIGTGRKITRGKVTNTLCIRIYVERKVAREAIPSDLLLPAKIDGVPTDVVEAGRFRALPATVPIGQRRLRPAKPGCSIGFQFTGSEAGYLMAGTFGAVVEAGGVKHILSNNHVLANENALPIGSPIFQPGLLDHGDPARDKIARLTRFIPLTAAVPNTVDCAIAEVLDPKGVRATFLPKIGRLKSAVPIEATENVRVHKSGRTTGYTTGTVFDLSADVKVEYGFGVITFQDQILIRGSAGLFSAAGDSGSVIVDRASGRPVALLFAGSSAFTVANSILDVLGKLGVSMVV
jgi:hypothetical protein